MHFDPFTKTSELIDGLQKLCDDFSSVDFIYLIPFFSRIVVCVDKLHDLMKGCFLNKDCHGNRRNTFLQLSMQQLLRGKMLH